jgi:glycosyltransferase involved in cell wall biosynthesis
LWTRRLLLGLAGTALAVPSLSLARLAPAWWVRPRCLRYIPNGVPVPEQLPLRAATLPGARPLVIGTVAGLRAEKNLARLLRAYAAVQEAGRGLRLVIVGDGPQRAELEALARQLGVADTVEFTGYLAAPRERLATFDLFALSSDTEQLPMSMLEAMALGIPVVSTRVGDVESVVPPLAHAGLSAADDHDYARALARVLDQRPLWPSWARAGHEHVRQHYSEAVTLEGWRAVYEGRFFDRVARP